MTVSNEAKIFEERTRLMEEGKIGTTGKKIKVMLDTETFITNEPEQIHTFAEWKRMNYHVKKGEKAITRLTIWMPVTKKAKEGQSEKIEIEPTDSRTHFYLKEACFFAQSQVEKIKS